MLREMPFLLMLAIGSGAPVCDDAAVSVEDFEWLVGSWEGTGLGGECEEVWSPARGGAMLGHFRLLRDGEPVFYELMILTRDEAGLSLRVKHFDPDFSAWEERAEAIRFPFSCLEGQSARFGGLTLVREGDALGIDVTFRDDDGSTRVEHLALRRRP